MKIWQNADKLMGVFVDEIQKSGLMFKFRDYIPVKIGESEYRIWKENIREILENAKHL